MEPTGNNDLPNINDLPFEIYYNDHLKDVILNSNNITDKKLGLISESFFRRTNEYIVKIFPKLQNKVIDKKPIGYSHKKIFMCLVNNLHDKAVKFHCNKKPPAHLNPVERIRWELDHFVELSLEIKKEKESKNEFYNIIYNYIKNNLTKKSDNIEAQLKLCFNEAYTQISHKHKFLSDVFIYSKNCGTIDQLLNEKLEKWISNINLLSPFYEDQHHFNLEMQKSLLEDVKYIVEEVYVNVHKRIKEAYLKISPDFEGFPE